MPKPTAELKESSRIFFTFQNRSLRKVMSAMHDGEDAFSCAEMIIFVVGWTPSTKNIITGDLCDGIWALVLLWNNTLLTIIPLVINCEM